MSLRPGNNQKKAQKHQNKVAFKIAFDTRAIEHSKKVSYKLLCERCVEQIKWKLQYNKYKIIGTEAKCTSCERKCIYRSYMVYCDPCASQKNVCAKCLNPMEQKDQAPKLTQEQKDNMKLCIEKMRERSRRTVNRKLNTYQIRWYNPNIRDGQQFIDTQTQKPLDNIKYKKNSDDFEDSFNEEDKISSDHYDSLEQDEDDEDEDN